MGEFKKTGNTINSLPPKGKYRIKNIYVNEDKKVIINYDDTSAG